MRTWEEAASGQGGLHGLCRLVAHTGQDVAVAVQRHGYGGVSQELLHQLGVVSAGEQQRGARMLEVVEPDIRQSGLLQ